MWGWFSTLIDREDEDNYKLINILFYIIIIIIIILIFIIKKFFLKKKLELKVWVVKSVDPQLSNTPKLLPAHWGMWGGWQEETLDYNVNHLGKSI